MSRLPSLGPRGEGWFIGQLAFFVAVGFAPPVQWLEPLASGSVPIGALLLVAGLVVAGRGLLDLGPNVTPFPRPRDTGALVEHGIYGVIRHPIYAGLILLAVGWSLARTSSLALLLAVAFVVFLDLKARREEIFLAAAFPGYEAYRRRTRRFVPGLY